MTATYTSEVAYCTDGLQFSFGKNALGARNPVQPIPWGIFSIEEAPKVVARPVFRVQLLGEPQAQRRRFRPDPPARTRTGFECSIPRLPQLNLNPDTGLTLTSCRYAFTYGDAGPGPYVDDPAAVPTRRRLLPTGLCYELTFQLPTHRNADPVEVVYKTVPIELIQGDPIQESEAR